MNFAEGPLSRCPESHQRIFLSSRCCWKPSFTMS